MVPGASVSRCLAVGLVPAGALLGGREGPTLPFGKRGGKTAQWMMN